MPDKIHLFRHAADARPVAAGETIFRRGDEGDVMYAVVEGEVDIIVDGTVVDTIDEGGIFGEMALIDREPRSADAVARTECRIVSIDDQRFMFLVQQTPLFSLQVMRIITGRLRKMNTQI